MIKPILTTAHTSQAYVTLLQVLDSGVLWLEPHSADDGNHVVQHLLLMAAYDRLELRASIQIDHGHEVITSLGETIVPVERKIAAMREYGRIAEGELAHPTEPCCDGKVKRVNLGSLPEPKFGTQTLSEHRRLPFLPIGRETRDDFHEIFAGDWLGDWSIDQRTALVCDGKLNVVRTTVHPGVPWEGDIMRDHHILERAQSFDSDPSYTCVVQVALKGALYGHPFYGVIAFSTTAPCRGSTRIYHSPP